MRVPMQIIGFRGVNSPNRSVADDRAMSETGIPRTYDGLTPAIHGQL